MGDNDYDDVMEVRIFVDSKGRELRQFSQVFGKAKEKVPDFYHGIAMMRVRVKAPNGQESVQERSVEFPFPPGVGLKRALELFDETAQKHMNELIAKERERVAASRVVAAKAMPALLGPNGKPMR